MGVCVIMCLIFFFQAEDGIRDVLGSRGLGDVYKRQDYSGIFRFHYRLLSLCPSFQVLSVPVSIRERYIRRKPRPDG